jgi:C-terminal processing protease CtpA/Prc
VKFDVDVSQKEKEGGETTYEVTAGKDVLKLGFTYSGGRNIVNLVKDDSWAKNAGIQVDDVMTEVNGADFLDEKLTPQDKHQVMRGVRPLRIKFVRNRVFGANTYFGR